MGFKVGYYYKIKNNEFVFNKRWRSWNKCIYINSDGYAIFKNLENEGGWRESYWKFQESKYNPIKKKLRMILDETM